MSRIVWGGLAIVAAGCGCGEAEIADAGVDAGLRDVGAPADAHVVPVRPLDAAAYLPYDAGPLPPEPCRDATRRMRFEGLPFDQIEALAGHGDRLATREANYDDGTMRARVFDVVAGVEVALSEAIPLGDARGGFSSDEIVAHAAGFDLVAWGAEVVVVDRLDRDGTLLATELYARGGEPRGIVPGAVVRAARGLIVLTRSGGEPWTLALEILAGDGVIRSIPLGVESNGEAEGTLAVHGDRVIGALALSVGGRDPPRFARFDVDLLSGTVELADVPIEAPGGATFYGRSATAAYVDDLGAVAAFALTAAFGEPSGLALVWWEVGGAELARITIEGVSIEGLGLLGIAGRMPQQAIALFTGRLSSRGSLLAGRIRAPGGVEGATSPLAVGIGLRYGVTWEWTEGAIAIAYSGNGRMEVILACEGVP